MNLDREYLKERIARGIAEHIDQPWDDETTDKAAALEVADAAMPVVDELLSRLAFYHENNEAWAAYRERVKDRHGRMRDEIRRLSTALENADGAALAKATGRWWWGAAAEA